MKGASAGKDDAEIHCGKNASPSGAKQHKHKCHNDYTCYYTYYTTPLAQSTTEAAAACTGERAPERVT